MRNAIQKEQWLRQQVDDAKERFSIAPLGPERDRLERHVVQMVNNLERFSDKQASKKAKKELKKTLAHATLKKERKPLPARGPKYAERKEAQFSHADGYSAFIRRQPCIRCGKPGPSECMHIKGVDLGGKAEDMLPACASCHRTGPHAQETHKREFDEWFLENLGITAIEMAHAMRAAFLLDLEK